jgi:hypothetical protein
MKLAWSCDESNRKECRNAHGCHCAEITHLLARKSAPDAALGYATRLLLFLWEKHWPDGKARPLPDMIGVLTQIDNAVANLKVPKQC